MGKWPKDLSEQRRWEALIWWAGKDKTGKNLNVLNLTRNFRLCSCHFDNENISTHGYTTGDPVYFAWDEWGKPLAWGRLERHRSAKPQMTMSPPLHIMFNSSQECSIIKMVNLEAHPSECFRSGVTKVGHRTPGHCRTPALED